MNATHVDVSGNLMKSFVELGKIGKYFRNLEILDASDAYYDEDVCNIESSGDDHQRLRKKSHSQPRSSGI